MGANIILFLTNALAAVPSIVQAATSFETAAAAVKSHVDATMAAVTQMQLENRDPTAEEWEAQNALMAQLLGSLNNLPSTVQTAAGDPSVQQPAV